MFALEALIIIIVGFILLRIAGKKVIAEMTPLEMVTTLAVGTIIGHAVSENELWKTIVTIGIFICVLIVFQFIALKWSLFQSLLIVKPTLVILDGTIIKPSLTKLRMTVEQLELRLRQDGISNLSDVKTATKRPPPSFLLILSFRQYCYETLGWASCRFNRFINLDGQREFLLINPQLVKIDRLYSVNQRVDASERYRTGRQLFSVRIQ